MGSHPWKAVTRYQANLEAALATAQQEVFARGEYGFAHKMKGLMELIAASGREPPPLPPERKARSIDEAREDAAEDGTCSVLDVYELADEPAPGAAGPLPPAELRRAFGGEHPTLAQAEANLDGIYERLGRGEAAYVVCYDGGSPSHILFVGMSFD